MNNIPARVRRQLLGGASGVFQFVMVRPLHLVFVFRSEKRLCQRTLLYVEIGSMNEIHALSRHQLMSRLLPQLGTESLHKVSIV